MTYIINDASEDQLAEVLHKGMLTDVRSALKGLLMADLEKEVDGAIDKVMQNMKDYVEAHYNAMNESVVFNVLIKKGA